MVHRSKDPTNSISVLKEHINSTLTTQKDKNTMIRHINTKNTSPQVPTHLPHNLYCVGGDVKHYSIQSNPRTGSPSLNGGGAAAVVPQNMTMEERICEGDEF